MLPISKFNNQNWLPGIFNDFFSGDWQLNSDFSTPAVNVTESDKSYTLSLAVPGVTKDDCDVKFNNGNLLISYEKKTDNATDDKKYIRKEFSYSKYQQSFSLPDDVDTTSISASVADGVLTVNLPKYASPVNDGAGWKSVDIC